MRILSKFNRLTVILASAVLLGMFVLLGGKILRQNEQAKVEGVHDYLHSHKCKRVGVTAKNENIIYECNGVTEYSSEIEHAVSLGAR